MKKSNKSNARSFLPKRNKNTVVVFKLLKYESNEIFCGKGFWQ